MGISQTPQALVPASLSSGAGNMAQIATGTLSGASVVISGLTSYTDILILMSGVTNNTGNGQYYLRLNETSTNHDTMGFRSDGWATTDSTNDSDFYLVGTTALRTNSANKFGIKLTNCKNLGFTDIDIQSRFLNSASTEVAAWYKGIYTKSEAVSSITLRAGGGTWAGGTYTVWGA